MNEKITFPRLAALLADTSGRSKRFSEDFLREFFALISERLEAGDSVKVKGLGTFKLSRVEPRRSIDVTTGQPMEITGHSKVVFIPSKELAEAVNAPFEAFTAIEISDDADLSQIFSKEEIQLQESEDSGDETDEEKGQAEAEEMAATEDSLSEESEYGAFREAAEETPEEEATPYDEEDTDDASPDEEEAEEAPEGETEADTEGEEIEEYEEEYEEEPRRKTWVRTLMISLGAAVFALIATFTVWYVFTTNDFNGIFNRTADAGKQKPTEGFIVGQSAVNGYASDSTEAEDSAEEAQTAEEPEVPTAPSDAIVYDTISTTRYLTTMAKSHYGNYNLWPYIYEENKAILGHPDRIRPGTPVVVPKLSKYGVDPTNAEDIEKAKKMGVEIYARYGKKI